MDYTRKMKERKMSYTNIIEFMVTPPTNFTSSATFIALVNDSALVVSCDFANEFIM